MLLISACGDSTDDGSGATDGPIALSASRVDESKALGTLSPDEQQTLCEDVDNWTATLETDAAYIQGYCRYNAITNASRTAGMQGLTLEDTRKTCADREAACVSGLSKVVPMPSLAGCAYPATCQATVGDVKACETGDYEAYATIGPSLPPCDAMQMDTANAIDGSLLTAAAAVCDRVRACGAPQ